MAKTPYQLWQEEQKKKQEGKLQPSRSPRKSNNIQYTAPSFKGSSETRKDNHQWEKDILKPLSIKQHGRSYNDKFDSFAKSEGLSPSETKEFRTWLDAKEDGVKTKKSLTDGILKSLNVRNQQDAKRIKETPKPKSKPKKVESKPQNKKPSLLNDILTPLKWYGQAINPFDDVGVKEAFRKNVEDATSSERSKGTKELTRALTRVGNSATLGSLDELHKKSTGERAVQFQNNNRGTGGKVADFGYDALGYLIPGLGAVKGAKAVGLGAKAGTKGWTKAGQLAKEGAIVGGAMGAAEIGIREGINGSDYTAKDNLKHLGISAAAGAIADPALFGLGKLAQTGLGKLAKGDVPTYSGKVSENVLSSLQSPKSTSASSKVSTNLYDELIQTSKRPKTEVPIEKRVKKEVAVTKQEVPKNTAFDKEFEDAVQQQFEYLKKSMGKGTTPGGLVRDPEGYVTGAFGRISNNPKWYSDFYAVNKRKPTNAELRELAVKHVKEGFEDEVGKVPKWSPAAVREIDDQITELKAIMQEDPGQEIALSPILRALEEDRAAVVKSLPIQPMKLPENIQALRGTTIPFRQPTGNRQFKEMGAIETLLNAGKRKLGGQGFEKPITRRELMDNMKKNLGVTLRTGRMGKVDDNVKGFFKVNEEVIRTKNHGDVQVISHEIGHHLDKQFKLSLPQFDGELMKLGEFTSAQGYTPEQIRAEGIAEFIRLRLTDPQRVLKEAPGFSKHFESVIPTNVKKGLEKTQYDVDRWIEQGDYFRASGKIDHKGDNTTISDKLDKTYSQLIDRYDLARRIEKDVTGKVNEANNSLYKRLRLSAGAPKIAERNLVDLKRILQPIDQYGYNKKEVSRYIAMVHARDLDGHGIESGFTKEEIDSVIGKLDTPEMQKIQKQLVMYSNNLLDMLVQSGRLSQKSVEAMREKYPNYVPFFRYFEDDMATGFGNKGFANLTNPVKRMKGSTRDVIDPLENLVKNTFAIINTAEKNKVGLELLKLTDFEGAGKYVEVVPGNKSVTENVVTVYKDGEPVQLQLDPELHRVVQRMDEETSNIVIKMLSVPAQTLRAGATLTPEFMLRNPIRDQFQAFVVSENGYFPPRDLTIGLWHAVKGKFGKSSLYEQWARSGGGYGNLMSVDRNYLQEQLKQLKREGHPLNKGFKTVVNPKEWVKLLQSLSELSEEATKLGEFRRATKKGKSLEEAAFESRDLMDFARSGTALKEWNKVVTFLNANVQGKDKLIRSFKSNPSRFVIKSITGVTLPAMGSYLAMQYLSNEKQKETWQNSPQWLKESFFFLPIPGTDVVARIPKPFDLAPLYASPVESFLDHVYKNDPATLEEFAKGTAVSLTKIPFMLTGIAPLIENWANKSFFTSAPIVPMRDQDVLPEDQYGVSTSLTARTIGKATNYAPYKVDNLIRGYGAGLGKYATSGMDKVLEALNVGKMPPKEEKRWSELPILNAFTVDSTGGGKVLDDYYNTLEKMRTEYQSSRKNNKDYAKEEEYKYLQYKVGKEMSELNAQYRNIMGSYDLAPAEKRRQLDQIDAERRDLARRALSDIGE